MVFALLGVGGCGGETSPTATPATPATSASDTAAPTAAPAPPSSPATLVVLSTGGALSRWNVDAPSGAPETRPADGTSVFPSVPGADSIDGVAPRGEALLVHAPDGVWLVTAGGRAWRPGDGAAAGFFSPDGRFAVLVGRRARPRCGGAGWHGLLTAVDLATGGERAFEGTFAGWVADDVIRVAVSTADCAPAGGMMNHATTHLVTRLDGGATSAADKAAPVYAPGPAGRRLVRLGEAALGLGGGITEFTYGSDAERFALVAPACTAAFPFSWSRDGRFYAYSVPAGEGATVFVRRADDHAVAGKLDGGKPLGTVGIGPPSAGAYLSPDGAHVVVSRADARVVRSRLDGSEAADLGMGSCAGYDPSGRFLLLYTTGGRTRPQLLAAGGTMADRRTLEGMRAAAWLPLAP